MSSHRLERAADTEDLPRHCCADFFERNYPEALRYPTSVACAVHQIRGWTAQAVGSRAGSRRAWPVRWGGMGLAPDKLIAFIEEQERSRRRAVRRTWAWSMVGPLLIQHGSEAKNARTTCHASCQQRGHLVSGLFRAQLGLRPGEPAHRGGGRR
jgi:hypothetical protein